MNRPLQPNMHYVERHTGYRYSTDGKGRVSSFGGKLQLAHGNRNSYQQGVSGGSDRLSTDQGGHLFAHIFRGPGERINLVPMDRTINLSDWKKMENTWANALKAGSDVQVSGRTFYPPGSSSLRPSHLLVTYQIDNQPPVVVPFRNK
ncbi:DNA/RNA non-specific endonuclease [Micromonospora pisi]|uniref:DNA/RNA non-specific endonuclease n=1 Tax=Micromonospora pisi TaxID=589240 RepID=A0A495JSY8_9ACTN|nr:DNA/RNA non-specific endonuclease [Micromonospora pisi]RKR92110.1 DNA/RNA non-specific endonuclease [Micromonospora pisi]